MSVVLQYVHIHVFREIHDGRKR